MTSIKFGSLNIPVIAVVERSGQPSVADSSSAVITASGLSTFEIFSGGTTSGDSGVSIDENMVTTTTSYVRIAGGRTTLGDASELIIGEPYDYGVSTVPAKNVDGVISHTEDESTISIASYDALRVMPGISGSGRNTDKFAISKLSAIAFWYPNANTEPGKRRGFVIVSTEQVSVINNSTGSSSVDYYQRGAWYINIPYYNVNKSLDMSFDETPIPSPDEPPFDPSEPEEYDKEHDDTSDTITIPTDPTVGVTSAGFINVYNPSIGALQGLGDFIFPDPIPDITQVTDVLIALIKICQTLANSNLINYVIDCHIIPYTPHTSGNANIKVGFRDTGINVPKVDSDYVTVACGSITLAEYFHGFQDYMLTRSRLYLPFLGFVDCKPEWWQDGTLTVDYKFNVIDGSFMAYIRSTSSKSNLSSSIIAQYAGNACMHLPLTGVNYSQMVSGVISAAVSPASAAKGASPALGVAYSALNTIMAGGEVQQSNGYNSTAAMLGVRTPYLMIERPSPSYPANYGHDKGMPTNISTTLSTITGFTVIEDIDLSGIPFTSDELTELRQLLAEGVYF